MYYTRPPKQRKPASPMSDDERERNHSKRSASPSGDQDGNDTGEQQGRQRARAACVPCRQRKRKCDGRMPCGTCVRYEYRCVYASAKRGSGSTGAAIGVPGSAGESSAEAAMPPYIDPHPLPRDSRLDGGRSRQRPAHPLTAPGARFAHRGILDPMKTRYVKANSAVAFPRILAMDRESETVPRLHSFGWNVGIRAEPEALSADISTLLTWEEMQGLAATYFAVVHAEFGLLDEADFMASAAARFANSQGIDDFDAIILGVAALGSYFSASPHPAEAAFLANAHTILHDRGMNRSPKVDGVAAWTLRTLYLRLVARPNAAWMTSCIAMHLVEGSGLHKELQSIAVVYPAAPMDDHKLAKTRRRVFWIAKAINVIVAFEYGRSRVHFDVVTSKRFASDGRTHAHQLVQLAELLPSDSLDAERESDPPSTLSSILTTIEDTRTESAFINCLRADMAFGIYRRLWLMSLTDAKDRSESVIGIGKVALEASAELLAARRPWWNILSTPFQFLCVLLAIDTPKSLALVPEVTTHLHRIAEVYDTHMVREAYNQALSLVNMVRARKEREVTALSPVQGLTPFEDPPSTNSTGVVTDLADVDWSAMEVPFDWDTFLNPDLIMGYQQSGLAGQYGF